LPCVQFYNLTSSLTSTIPALQVNSISIYVVARRNSNSPVIQRLLRVPGTPTLQLTASATSYVYSFFAGTGRSDSSTLSTGGHIFSGIGTATEAGLYTDGSVATLADASDPSGTTGTVLYVGEQGGGPFPGNIMEVLVYSESHNTATRQSIERSLGSKYGITVA
jgi:hypothetical protein